MVNNTVSFKWLRSREPIITRLFLCCLTVSSALEAAVFDTAVTDVTTRAFSIVWMSDTPINSATLHVFSDADGVNEITQMVSINFTSANFPKSLDLGLAKIDVIGLEPDTVYYVETETITTDPISGETVSTFYPPAQSPFIEVKTALSTTRENIDGSPIVNDLISHEIFQPDGQTPSEGTLLMIKIPGISQFPLTAFVGDGFLLPQAVIDLNNQFSDVSGSSSALAGGEVMEITEYRGLLCNASNHKLERLRKVPLHQESPPITEIELPAPCYSPNDIAADFNCDNRIGGTDFVKFASHFGLVTPDCRFNSDFDLNADGRIGGTDFIRFSSVFGSTNTQQ